MPKVLKPNLNGLGLTPEVRRTLDEHFGSATAAINKALVPGQSLQVFAAKTVSIPSDWVSLTPATGWANVAGKAAISCRRLLNGDVELMGWVNNASSPSSGSVIGTLPSAYLPANYRAIGTVASSGFGLFDVDNATGNIIYRSGNVATNLIINARFEAANRVGTPPSCFPVDWPLLLETDPQFVIVRAVDTDTPNNPSVVSALLPDWTVTTTSGGRRMLRIRSMAGLFPGHTYSLTAAAF